MQVTSSQVPVLLDSQGGFGTRSLDTWREGNVIVLYLLEDKMPGHQGLTQKLMVVCVCLLARGVVLICEKVRIRVFEEGFPFKPGYIFRHERLVSF